MWGPRPRCGGGGGGGPPRPPGGGGSYLLLEFLEGPGEPGRNVGGGDAEHARGLVAVEVEEDAQRNHLALAVREGAQCRLELGREPLAKARVGAVLARRGLLAPPPPLLGAEPVERGRARDLAEPRTGAPGPRGDGGPEAE